MPSELWPPLISLISAAFGASIGGWVALKSKRDEYANAYYRMVLDRRLAAYEEIERLIVQIKVAVVDEDGQPYHVLFSKDDDHLSVYKTLFSVVSKALWLSDDLFEKTRELNVLIYAKTKDASGLIQFGREHYRQVAELRTQIEKLHARDMLSLHQVPKFLKSKKPHDSYVAIEAQS